jgi:hypothetical protein
MKTKKNKTNIFEVLWLITAMLCFFAAIHQTYREGFSESYILFIFTALAVIMYLLRRYLRVNKKSDQANG